MQPLVLSLPAANDVRHPAGDRVADRGVEDRAVVRAAQAHVGDRGRRRGSRALAGHPVDAGDDLGVGAVAGAVEHADGRQRHALGDAVRGAADRAGDVRAVAVAVGRRAAGGDRVVAGRGAPAEVDVAEPDAGVEDVDGHAGAGRVVAVGRVERQGALVDAVEAPRRGTGLGGLGDAAGAAELDRGDVGVAADAVGGGRRCGDREALQGMAVRETDLPAVGPGQARGGGVDAAGRHALEGDDVRVGCGR